MPAMRRWRLLAIAIILAITSFYYLSHPRNVWNYGYSGYLTVNSLAKADDGRVHWKRLPDRYPVKQHILLPTGRPQKIPAVQVAQPKENEKQRAERLRRRTAVKESFNHSWAGYRKHAWLRDEVAPLSGLYRDTFGGWAATLVDALDTLWIMDMKDDFEIAVKAAETIDFTTTAEHDINVFETTIRYLGGFLAAYDISAGKYPILLVKATEVGDLLMSCFDTPNRMPITRWDWQEYTQGVAQEAPDGVLVSELGSLTLEFTRLAQLTGDPKYYDAVQRISNEFEKSQNSTKLPGMWPISVNAHQLLFRDNAFTLGGMSDSLYEYLPKQYLMLGGVLTQPKTMYEKFIETAKQTLFFRVYNPENKNITISGDTRIYDFGESTVRPRGEHLTCFTGGMVGLGSKIFNRPEDFSLAEELTQGCIWAYDSFPNGIMPEIFTVLPCPANDPCVWDDQIWHDKLATDYPFNGVNTAEGSKKHVQDMITQQRLPKGFTSVIDRRYILRPEAIESVFLMYRMTGKQIYMDAAWRMFQAIERVTRTHIAAAALQDITVSPADADKPTKTKSGQNGEDDAEAGIEGQKIDSMESFWLAETLKYFYLVFEEWDVVSLDEWVLNTEAHPLRRPR